MNPALIAPTPPETGELRREIRPQPDAELKIVSECELHGKSIVFTHCGVGKVNAAHSATLMVENYDVDLMILFGIGGGYKGARIGDVAVAQSENYAEEGILTEDGWKSMEFIGFPLLKNEKEYFNTFPMDSELSQLAVKISGDLGFNAAYGNFITVSQCSGTRESGELLKKRFDGICENMEGAAVAHICAMYGIPVVEIRGISNIIEKREPKKWNIPLAVSNCNKVVSELVKRI
ncbi:MAG: futalosine hydrolase [Candidatus Methanoperedens sp.]|nr:futalosine hydrolase [Candidatus Methanoperedens sp.]MCZ7384315.1 futalosine hydrolase [Candidatus Methanoperedens sp.]MCZ7404604.1 futalosine hydrolase [Candidatus Methanoperedens sp.]